MSRTFNQPDVTGEAYYDFKNCGDSSYTRQNTGTYTKGRKRGYYAGARTPKYYKAVKEGSMLPLNAYRRWDYTMSCEGTTFTTSCDCSPTGTWRTINVNNHVPPDRLWSGSSPLLPNYWVVGRINTDALVIAAMADILPELDALTSAIEARQTVNMVLNARSDAKKLILMALRGGKHTAKAASEAWLAWRYGWEQLGRDVSNCYEFLKEPLSDLIVTGQSGQSHNWEESGDLPSSSWTHHGLKGSYTVVHDVSYRARVVAKWRFQTLNAIADPTITLWESVPFSFVADWFVNVGDVLAAWNVRRSVSSLHASLGEKYTSIATSTLQATPGICAGSVVSGGPATKVETLTGRSRFPWSVPSLVPSITVNLTTKRLADAAALLRKRIF